MGLSLITGIFISLAYAEPVTDVIRMNELVQSTTGEASACHATAADPIYEQTRAFCKDGYKFICTGTHPESRQVRRHFTQINRDEFDRTCVDAFTYRVPPKEPEDASKLNDWVTDSIMYHYEMSLTLAKAQERASDEYMQVKSALIDSIKEKTQVSREHKETLTYNIVKTELQSTFENIWGMGTPSDWSTKSLSEIRSIVKAHVEKYGNPQYLRLRDTNSICGNGGMTNNAFQSNDPIDSQESHVVFCPGFLVQSLRSPSKCGSSEIIPHTFAYTAAHELGHSTRAIESGTNTVKEPFVGFNNCMKKNYPELKPSENYLEETKADYLAALAMDSYIVKHTTSKSNITSDLHRFYRTTEGYTFCESESGNHAGHVHPASDFRIKYSVSNPGLRQTLHCPASDQAPVPFCDL